MPDSIKIASLNLCLGLRNKKEAVKQLIHENNISVLCVQEAEIPVNFDTNLLTFKGYSFENENNLCKSRCGIFVSNEISYVRMNDLELPDMHVVIIDISDSAKTRIINVYRPFNPPNNQTQIEFFEAQLNLIKRNTTQSTIIVGDFNLDQSKSFDVSYSHKKYFESLRAAFEPINLIQLVSFPTWSRVINNILCSSSIDHVYIKDPTRIKALYPITPPFGDHLLILIETISKNKIKPSVYKRNWKNYSPEKLNALLRDVNWQINFDSVQSYWNSFESKLVEIVDKIAPLELQQTNVSNTFKAPPNVKNKINKRNRLKKKLSTHPDPNCIRQEIKTLNKEIKSYFHKLKSKNVRKGIVPGNSKSLWDAVKKAKDLNVKNLPDILFKNKIKLSEQDHAAAFANFFSTKVNTIVNETQIEPGVYNGVNKLNVDNEFFMTKADITECIKSIKTKNCEGYDRIPQRILTDGAEVLITPFVGLFKRVYVQNAIPDQWSIAKVAPIHKKGLKCDIENYRPIANLCSSSKLFEKLILKRMSQIENLTGIDLTGKQQHGFKRNKSTTTLSLQLQSLIARALDEDNFALMASVDLSAAFDVVNIDLLLVRLRLIGLPGDLVGLIEVWLRNRFFYVEVSDHSSNLLEINTGTIQGSILGPILYAIYVAPLFDLTDLSNFADDNFILSIHKIKEQAIESIEIKLKIIIKWLTDSGLKVNEQKTELCLFYRKDTPPIVIRINDAEINSTNSMNVLGITFDSKLTWAKHVAKQVAKSNKALQAIKMIRKFFNHTEILMLLTSNFFSILYYNSEVWHIPKLKPVLNQLLMSASANALKLSQRCPNMYESFLNIHKSCKRATPTQMIKYKHAILIHKLYNQEQPRADWIDLNFNQTFTSRQTKFKTIKNNNFKVGNNLLSNRLTVVNDEIDLIDLNLSLNSFKVKYKKLLLNV